MHIELTQRQKAIHQAIQSVGFSGALTAHMNLFIEELGDIIRGRLVSGAFKDVELTRFQLNPNAHSEWLISSPQATHPRIRARLETIVRAIDPFNPGSEDPVKTPFSVEGSLIGEYIQQHVKWLKENCDIPLARDFTVNFEADGKTQTADIEFLAVERRSHVGDLYVKVRNPTENSYLWCENSSFIAGIFDKINSVHGTNIQPFSRSEMGMQSNDMVCFEPSKKENSEFIVLIESLGFVDANKEETKEEEAGEDLHAYHPSN